MATASFSGRSRKASKPLRSHRTKPSGRLETRKAGEEDDTQKPDVQEIRRRRTAYFGLPYATAAKAVQPKMVNMTGLTKSRGSTVADVKRKRRKHTSSSSGSTRKKSSEKGRTAGGYVYGARSSDHVLDNRDAPGNGHGTQHTLKHSDLNGYHLPTVDEDEVAPDDSVSVVEARRSNGRSGIHRSAITQKDAVAAEEKSPDEDVLGPDDSVSVIAEKRRSRPHRTSSRDQYSLRRSNTTPSKSRPMAESSTEAKSKSSKRDSSLLATLLRRNTTTSSTPTAPPRLVECLTCGADDIPRQSSAKLVCGHRMCHDCLKRIFELSVKDPQHMPPKCCTEDFIPLKYVDRLFDLRFKMLWNRKYQEYHTKDRIYCPNSKCGDWIKPRQTHTYEGRKYVKCSRCSTKVCVSCNSKMHKSRDCPDDPEMAKLIEMAKEKGWQRCYECHAMVELREGCNHLTCRCMAEFCMLCGVKWKGCNCPWFNYASPQNGDRLDHMRVPQPIQMVQRQVLGGPQPRQRGLPQEASIRPRDRTYQEELDERRQQERLDADLARRMQLASLMGEEDEPPPPRWRAEVETWDLGNAAGHFMNDNFVQNAANVVMSAFGDADVGRRGDRASGRRRRARQASAARDGGLVPNFLGDESVLGAGPAPR